MLAGLSLFFPCHNEEANIDKVTTDALRVAPQVAASFEIIIVDDGSTDSTPKKAQEFAAQGFPVRLVRHNRCMGYGAAVKSGIKSALLPWIFFSDGDDQFDLSELPRLIAKSDNADIVTGYRSQRADPWHRKLNSWIYEQALHVFMGLDVRDVNCAFKLYRKNIFDNMELQCSGALINAEIFAKARRHGYRILSVAVSHKPRTAGEPTGAKPSVIFKAMREFWSLWLEVRFSRESR